jgi:hypothetical protein
MRDGSYLTSVSLSFEKSNEGGPDQEILRSEVEIKPLDYANNPQYVHHFHDEDLEEACHYIAQGHFGNFDHGLKAKGLLRRANGTYRVSQKYRKN